MYKLLIVDDDQVIRRGICNILDWKTYGFEIIGDCGDGELALKIMENNMPDILISDIRMPFMDGLQLAEAVYQRYPRVKVILLTAYEDFSYAKNAIKFKVFDYLVKPLDMSELLQVVQAAADEIKTNERNKNRISDSQHALLQQFFSKLNEGIIDQDLVATRAAELGLSTDFQNLLSTNIQIDDYEKFVEGQNRVGECLKYGIVNVCKEIALNNAADIQLFAYYLDSDQIYITWLDQNLARDLFEKTVYRDLVTLSRLIYKNLNVTLTIGIGNVYNCLFDVRNSFRQAEYAIEFRHILGKNRLINYNEITIPDLRVNNLQQWDKELINKTILGQEEEALKILRSLEDQLKKQFASLESIHFLAVEIVILLFDEMRNWKNEFTDMPEMKDYYWLIDHVSKGQTIEEIFGTLRELLSRVCNCADSGHNTTKRILVKTAQKYIQEHYTSSDLSLDEVSDQVHVSPTYFSLVFKQVMHINFSEYLLDVRMAEAKLLLEKSDLKLYEIAERVGYNNSNYFSTSFKKYTGISPTEYKNLGFPINDRIQ